jgi:hypothetical protein
MPKFATDVAEQLKILPGMSAPALRTLWEKAFNKPPPAWMHHGFLVRALAYHMQEKAYGAMGTPLRRPTELAS